jgi:diguanylate cyclase (GGDEF)-like protein
MIDGRSLLAVAAALCLLLGLVVLALERRMNEPMPGLRLWAIANFTLGAGAALHMLQGVAPLWVPSLAGNALLLAGRAFSVASVRQFDHQPVPRRTLAAVCVVLTLGVAAALLVWPNFHLRGALVVGGMALLAGWAAASLTLGRPWRISRAVTVAGLAAMAVSNLSRLWAHATATDAPAALNLNTPAIAFYIGVLLVCDVLSNVGFVLLVTDRMHDWVLQLARTDHLTGTLSRGALCAQAQRDLQRARRQRCVTAAFIVDIDKFKTINDQCGHAAGDAVLRHVARQGQQVLRCTDLFARWGGDEFVAVLPETDLLTAAAIAERLRAAVAQLPPGTIHDLPPITVSIGVAAVAAGAHGLDELIAQADQALYNAKNGGRNRTRVADDAVAPENTSLHLLQGRH